VRVTVESRHLSGVVVLIPGIVDDERGFFSEVYRKDQFEELGLPGVFVQENHSRSFGAVIRGLHFQRDPSMGKLMRVMVGSAFLVAVDIRPGSPTRGQWFGIEASADNRRQVWAPAGFARGFCVLSDSAEVQYKCTGLYNASGESGIRWNDPALGIDWPVNDPIISQKDAGAQSLAEWLARPESRAFDHAALG
jgi:dTDP-4-dehydrorhamnose 3,5-epimerase